MTRADSAGTRVASAADDRQAHWSIRLLLDEGSSLDAPLRPVVAFRNGRSASVRRKALATLAFPVEAGVWARSIRALGARRTGASTPFVDTLAFMGGDTLGEFSSIRKGAVVVLELTDRVVVVTGASEAPTSSDVVKRPVAKPPGSGDDRLASGVGVDAGGLSDLRGHAVVAEPKLGDNGPGGDAVDADAARPNSWARLLLKLTSAALEAR
jgi:hypothetical protein